MTSRSALWIGLSLATLPLYFGATTGCDVVFPLREPNTDNAVGCDCTCDAPAIPAEFPVLVSSDDAEQTGQTMDLTDGDLDLGEKIVGVRFDNVLIAPGAKITRAYVQFESSQTVNTPTNLSIFVQLTTSTTTFTTTNNDLTNRPVGPAVAWTVDPWINGDVLAAEQTPDLSAVLQQLIDLPGWASGGSVVLRISGTGQRAAKSFNDGGGAHAPRLVVSIDASVTATLPVCARPGAELDDHGRLTAAAMSAECARAEDTLEGLNLACGYPTPCTCTVVDVPGQPDGFNSAVCVPPCMETPLADTMCSNFNPNAFQDCVDAGGTAETCKSFVAATNVSGDSPVCVASGSPFAFQLFGRRSQCNVAGTSAIHIGDREPKQDPVTDGIVELLGGQCPGAGCKVYPFFNLRMDPITFSVRWHSDPTFSDLGATGHGLQSTAVDGSGLATFAANTITGTGSGRRGSDGGAVDSTNGQPLLFGIDWAGHTCTMNGNLATSVGDDGLCDGDGTTACRVDSPDCDGVGGPCTFDDATTDEMQVDVALTGQLVNQPPSAVAGGANRNVECTSPAGATFTLDGRGSSDPDANLTLASWRKGSRTGVELSNGLVVNQRLGLGASQSYVLRVIDSFAQADEDTTTVKVVDTTPPVVTCSVATPDLNTTTQTNHNLTTVGLAATAVDVCEGALSTSVLVYGDENDEEDTGDGKYSPDAKNVAVGSLRLRNERKGSGDGRVYLIVPQASDSSSNRGFACCTVTVPSSSKAAAINSVHAQAAAAKTYCLAHGGTPPPNYFVIGDGPVIGPKQ